MLCAFDQIMWPTTDSDSKRSEEREQECSGIGFGDRIKYPKNFSSDSVICCL